MTEALTAILDHGFGVMGLNRVQVLVMPRNARSLRLVRRLGFVREGVLREHGLDETGAVGDDVVLSLLRREWTAPPRGGMRRGPAPRETAAVRFQSIDDLKAEAAAPAPT